MSDHICFDIQTEIIKRLGVKSLLRFRSVSKTWKSLIDSPKFVASYGIIDGIQMHHHLLVQSWKPSTSAFMSYVDDDNDDSLLFGQTIVPLLPSEVHICDNYRILGSSHGLFCLYCEHCIEDRLMYVIWNPSIRKSVVIEDRQTNEDCLLRRVCFVVCPVTCDPKLVRVTINFDLKWLVQVYTLSSGSWREITNNLPCRAIIVDCTDDDVVVTNKFIYWDSTDPHNDSRRLVVCFDLTSEEFTLIDITDYIAHHDDYNISKVRDTLVFLRYLETEKVVYEVWMMMNDNGVSKTFKKLFNITLPNMFPYGWWVRGFKKSGTPLIDMAGCGNPIRDFMFLNSTQNVSLSLGLRK